MQTGQKFSITESDEELIIESTGRIEEGIVKVEEDALDEIDLLEFTVEAKQDTYLESLDVRLSDNSDYIDYLSLSDDRELLDEFRVSGSGRYEILPMLELDAGETYTFMISGETHDILREDQGGTVSVEIIDALALDYYDYEIEGLDIDAEGEDLEVYVAMPEFTLLDQRLYLFGDNKRGDGFVEFEIEAAGGDILIDYIDFSNTGRGDFHSPIIVYDGDDYQEMEGGVIDLSGIDAISEGDTVEVMVEGVINGAGSRERVKVFEIGWSVEDYDGDDGFIYQSIFSDNYDFIDDLETERKWISDFPSPILY